MTQDARPIPAKDIKKSLILLLTIFWQRKIKPMGTTRVKKKRRRFAG
jgi:hypothetical protein